MSSAAATVFDADIVAGPRYSAARAGHAPKCQRVCPIELESYRPGLTSYAGRILRSAADAQDAVQETLAAAVATPDACAGRSSTKTWLYGILKHKIIDILRRQSREPALADLRDCESQEDIDALFAHDGQWNETPAHWGSPEAQLQQRDFFDALEACIACLPARTAAVFTMREVMELEVSEICDVLDITPNHCFVMLHRARMKLRVLLDQRWFAGRAPALCLSSHTLNGVNSANPHQ